MLACRALNSCAFEDVKVVIVGQDPYHNDGQVSCLQHLVHHLMLPGAQGACACMLILSCKVWPVAQQVAHRKPATEGSSVSPHIVQCCVTLY